MNRVLVRSGVALELGADGLVRRLAPEEMREGLVHAVFQTGDTELDALLCVARAKFLSPDPAVRKEGLEKLWDAWERLKTLEDPQDKKRSAQKLIAVVSAEDAWRSILESEARELTEIGNKFQIRHYEIGKVAMENSAQVDYLYSRLFSLMRLLLKASGRGG